MAPLPITSILLESVAPDGRRAPIGAFSDFDAAENALVAWAEKRSAAWPGGVVPVGVRVSFPRRLVFSYDFLSDDFGLMSVSPPLGSGAVGSVAQEISLRQRLVGAMHEAMESDDLSVEAIQLKRVARIVLAYGDPAPLGN